MFGNVSLRTLFIIGAALNEGGAFNFHKHFYSSQKVFPRQQKLCITYLYPFLSKDVRVNQTLKDRMDLWDSTRLVFTLTLQTE